MDNDTLRVVLASVLGPVFWGWLLWLSDRIAERRAAHDWRRREQRLYHFGVKLGTWLRRARRLHAR